MIWEVEIHPLGADAARDRAAAEFDLLTLSNRGRAVFARTSHGYLIEGQLSTADVEQLSRELLTDSLVERPSIGPLNEHLPRAEPVLTVLLKPGVMDPAALSV